VVIFEIEKAEILKMGIPLKKGGSLYNRESLKAGIFKMRNL